MAHLGYIGLGTMGMSDLYGPADETESVATIHAAMDAGINLLDTGDFYGEGHNELLIREALRTRDRDDVVISVKFGARKDPTGAFQHTPYDTTPAGVRDRLAYTLRRLGTDHVDIYRPARLNPDVPVEDTVGAIAEMVQAGYVRHIGLSEVGADTLRRAAAVHPIADLQIEYSLVSRGIESAILPTARELGIGITAYGVLSRGLLSGHYRHRLSGTPYDASSQGPTARRVHRRGDRLPLAQAAGRRGSRGRDSGRAGHRQDHRRSAGGGAVGRASPYDRTQFGRRLREADAVSTAAIPAGMTCRREELQRFGGEVLGPQAERS